MVGAPTIYMHVLYRYGVRYALYPSLLLHALLLLLLHHC